MKGESGNWGRGGGDNAFARTLRSAIRSEFGTQDAFAKALNVTPGQISHYLDDKHPVRPESLNAILETFRSPALQELIHEAWVAQYAPLPFPPLDTGASEVIKTCEQFVGQGLTRRAIAFAEQALNRISEPDEWQRVAERVVPWRLRVSDISRGWTLSNTVEERARARGDRHSVLSALAMKGTVLRLIEAVTPAAIGRLQSEIVAEMQTFQPANQVGRKRLRYRRASVYREYALHLLHLVRLRKIAPSHLADAKRNAEASLETDGHPIIQSAGLEVMSRIELARGKLVRAEDMLDELEDIGLDKAFELWEKSQCTRALILKARKDPDGAVAILEALRDHCERVEDWHHFRRADQLLAQILAGV